MKEPINTDNPPTKPELFESMAEVRQQPVAPDTSPAQSGKAYSPSSGPPPERADSMLVEVKAQFPGLNPPPRPPGTPEEWHWSPIMRRYCPGPSDEELASLPPGNQRCLTLFLRANDKRASEGKPALTLDDWLGPSPGEK